MFAVDLGAALSGLGHAVRTVSLAPGASASPLDVPTLGASPLGFATLRVLRREARRVQVVIAHGSRTLPACALALPCTGVPCVYRNIGDLAYWSARGLRHLRTTMFLSRPGGVVALTDGAAATLRDHYRVPDRKLTVIPSAASAARHVPATPAAREAARASLGIPADAPIAAVIGALSREKGVDLAIAAAALVPELHLVVAGDGPERAALEHDATERVHFTGALADPSPAFDAADVIVLPSRTEGLPGVLIEAGMRALPAVATDVGYVRDIVLDGETGAVVTPEDPDALAVGITAVLDGAMTMGARARERCLARFELAPITAQWNAFIELVVSERRAGRGVR